MILEFLDKQHLTNQFSANINDFHWKFAPNYKKDAKICQKVVFKYLGTKVTPPRY